MLRCHFMLGLLLLSFFFFFNDTATTEIYTLSLHDALPISSAAAVASSSSDALAISRPVRSATTVWKLSRDRKSTRLNSSHLVISYAVFCLKKKKKYIIARGTDYRDCSRRDRSRSSTESVCY